MARQQARFDPSATGAGAVLGPLERLILDAVWSAPGSNVADVQTRVHERTSERPAYTTVKTVMERLTSKGLLRRVREGRAYRYTATATRKEFEGRTVRRLIADLLGVFGSAAVTHFAEAVRDDPERLRELQSALEPPPAVPSRRTRKGR
ncbi:MAG: BlaI/MecI/CopY family transcriptional regulator [Gemmatimonadales bacterium]